MASLFIKDAETAALDAYDRYGKGNHRANLNMADCFAKTDLA